MGLDSSIVVLLCIIGAAATVTVGFAFQKLFGKPDPATANFNEKKPEQEAYMREVRSRNMMAAIGEARPAYHGHREM